MTFRSSTVTVLSGLLVSASLAAPDTAHAARHRQHARPAAAIAAPVSDGIPVDAPLAIPSIPAPPDLPEVASYILMDASTGAILAEKAPDARLPPASFTKVMTAYLAYQAIHKGTLKADQTLPISPDAWHAGGSRMFLSPDMANVTVDQLLHGLIIDSGNDAAIALAEGVSGSTSAFVALMNNAAAALHLTNTAYTNPTGLPDPGLYSSAMDMAVLSRALIRAAPEVLQISAQKGYTFNNITQRSWNPVLFRDSTVDGLKTGMTDGAGHCIDATAVRDNHRLIAVVMKGPTWRASTDAVEALLAYGFQFYTDAPVLAAGHTLGTLSSIDLTPGAIPVGAGQDLTLTLPKTIAEHLATTFTPASPLSGPIAKGAPVGTITITSGQTILATQPAVALEAAQPASWWRRLTRRIEYRVHRAFTSSAKKT